MPAEGFSPLVSEQFHGAYTLPDDPQQVKDPYAVSAKNVQFGRGGVRTRPGYTTQATLSGVAINSIKQYIANDPTIKRVLAFASDGSLRKEPSNYVFSTVSSNIFSVADPTLTIQMNSVSSFGREYMGFANSTGPGSNAGIGWFVPLSYDDTNLDPVAPSGPAGAPTVQDDGGGGDLNGNHTYRVLFRTRSGFLTAPGPSVTLFSTGPGRKALFTLIPTGPQYVIGRVICATPRDNTTDFYFIAGSKMDIRDNATTLVSAVTFTDTALIAGTQVSVRSNPTGDLLNCINLGQQGGALGYHNRIGWFGEQQSIPLVNDLGFRNLAFDGGWNGNVPLGWTELTAGETKSVGVSGLTGDGLTITGTGINNPVGVIQNASNFMPLIQSGVQLAFRARVATTIATGNPTLYVYLVDSSVAANTLPTNFGAKGFPAVTTGLTWYGNGTFAAAFQLIPATVAITPTTVLRIGVGLQNVAGDSLAAGDTITIDRLEIYAVKQIFNPSLVRWSRVFQPDAYDALYGIQLFGQDDGQKITGGFQLGENYYVVKDRSIYVTRDDGSNEPANWSISALSNTKGSPSSKGVGLGDRWVVIAGRSGLHLFNGWTIKNISDEIRGTWKTINWGYGALIYVTVDTVRRRITVGVPLGADTTIKTQLVLEYFGEGPGEERRWSTWTQNDTTLMTCWCPAERSDGTQHMLYGTNARAGGGVVASIDDTSNSDFGASVAIVSSYRFAYHGPEEGRYYWGYMTMNVLGSGTLSTKGYLPDNVTTITPSNRGPANINLSTAPAGAGKDYPWDIEWTIDATAERVSWEVGTTGGTIGDWFALNRLTEYVRPKPWTHLRGIRGSS